MLGLLNFPLMLVPLAVYNLFVFAAGLNPWEDVVLRADMPSGSDFSMTLGEALVCLSLLMLMGQAARVARQVSASLVDKALSALVFLAFVLEFLFVDWAATSTFFLLLVTAFADVLVSALAPNRAGVRRISIEPRAASRD